MRTTLLAAVFAALGTTAAHGAVITVTTNAVDTGGPGCRIRDAITAANTDTATGGCIAGTMGSDTIELPEGAVFEFVAADNIDTFSGSNALPIVTGDLAIEGNGATLERIGACTPNAVEESGEFRLLRSNALAFTVRDLSFRNGCADGGPASGGALALAGTAASLERVVFDGNRSNTGGGALSISGAPVPGGGGLTTIVDAHFLGNAAPTGGALQSTGVSLDLSRATFAGNTATAATGGAVAASAFPFPGLPAGTVRIRNATFSGNGAAAAGGAIHIQDNVRLELSFSTLANNLSATGALSGAGFPGFPPTIPPSLPTVVLRGNWLSENAGGNCVAPGGTTYTSVVEGANLSTDATCPQFTPSPPGELEALADFGGFAPTRRPLPGSAGIDAAPDCVLAGGGIAVAGDDQRGLARPIDGDADGTPQCDVGAVELDPGAPPVLTAPASVTTLSDAAIVFGASFGNAITLADADAGVEDVRLEIASTNGVLSLATTAGLAFEQGDGTADSLVRFTGTLAAIGAAIDGLAFAPDAGYTGAASLVLTANDLGNTGEGIPQSDTATVAITVAVRAAIANLAPASLVFGGRAVDAGPSAAQSIVLRNDGNIPLTGILFKLVPSDYALVHDCGTSLAPGEDCTLLVTFDPSTGGSRLGVLAVLSNGTTSPNGVVLTGTGLADLVFSNGYE